MADGARDELCAGPCPGRRCRAGARKCRTRSGAVRTYTHPWRGDSQGSSPSAAAVLLPDAARARDAVLRPITDYLAAFAALDRHELAALALTLGVILFAVVTAIVLVRTPRAHRADARRPAEPRSTTLREERDRANALLHVRAADHRGLAGRRRRAGNHRRRLDRRRARRCRAACSPSAPGSSPTRRRRWSDAVEALRTDGKSFSLTLTTLQHRHVAAEGRAIGGRAVLRLQDVTGAKSELAELAADHQQLRRDIDTLGRLLEALPSPVWARDADRPAHLGQCRLCARRRGARRRRCGRARSRTARPAARDEARRARAAGELFEARLPVIVAGTRRIFDVIDRPTPRRQRRHRHRRHRSRGDARRTRAHDRRAPPHARPARDRRRDLRRRPAARHSTMPPIACCGSSSRRSSIRSPTDSAVLDRLRAARKLPEQADFRNWKSELHEAYRALEPREHEWHLPDGRTLRVVTTPNPEGGVTYLFDDVTERLKLERRYDALIRVQGETLETLAEGVAVFGSDGRLDLHNPAFARHVAARADALNGCDGERPHIEAVIALVPAAVRRRRVLGAAARRRHRRSEQREPIDGAARAPRRQRARLRHRAAARRRHAGDLPGRHRHGQCRARADRAQRCAAGRRPAQERVRAARVLRAALAAHQHHRLRAACSDDPVDRAAHRASSANISATSTPRRARCSPSSTTSSISPPSTPAR